MAKHLDEAIDLDSIESGSLTVIYGKSNSGKTKVGGTWPKPMLYLQIGDRGHNTLRGVEGIKAIVVRDLAQFKEILQELKTDKKYKSVMADTFSLVTQEWIEANAVSKKKKMTQNMWGEVKTDTEELIKLAYMLAQRKHVVLTCHEATDSFEGMEDEILPDVRPSVTKGARTYLEAVANLGIHTVVMNQVKEGADGATTTATKYACHLGPNPYYWTKTQKPPSAKVPDVVINPSYQKIMKLLEGTKDE